MHAYIHTYIHAHPYRCTNTNGSFTCNCNAGYYTVEERQAASNCSLLIYESGNAGVHVHFENKGLGTFCFDIGMCADIQACYVVVYDDMHIHTSIHANKQIHRYFRAHAHSHRRLQFLSHTGPRCPHMPLQILHRYMHA